MDPKSRSISGIYEPQTPSSRYFRSLVPETVNFRSLVPKIVKSMVFRTTDLKSWVLGPSGRSTPEEYQSPEFGFYCIRSFWGPGSACITTSRLQVFKQYLLWGLCCIHITHKYIKYYVCHMTCFGQLGAPGQQDATSWPYWAHFVGFGPLLYVRSGSRYTRPHHLMKPVSNVGGSYEETCVYISVHYMIL